MEALEAIHTAGSMRWLRPDPVSDELIDEVIRAATCAASPGNVQPWEFVVVKDEATRREVARIITSSVAGRRRRTADDRPDDPTQRRILEGVEYLLEHFAETPALVFICGRNVYPASAPRIEMMYSAVFGAAQNLLVAARAVGLGAAYTTFHGTCEPELKHRLGIPEDVHICVTVPLGWPARRYGHLTRKPLALVVHRERW